MGEKMDGQYQQTTAFTLRYRLQQRRPYTREEVRRLPSGRCGLYALWLPSDDPECLYVGKSETCIRTRLLGHLSSETNPDLRRELRLFRDRVKFSVAYTANIAETDALETEVIRAWQPLTNRYKL